MGSTEMAVLEKQQLSVAELASQTAIELPDRETPSTFVANCVAVCVGGIEVSDVNVSVDVAAQVCAGINAALALLLSAAGAGKATVECKLDGANVSQR